MLSTKTGLSLAAFVLVPLLVGCSPPSLGERSEDVAREMVNAAVDQRVPKHRDFLEAPSRNESLESLKDELNNGFSLYHSSIDMIGDGVYNVYVAPDRLQGRGFIVRLEYDKNRDGFRLAGYSVPMSIPPAYDGGSLGYNVRHNIFSEILKR